MRKEDLNAMEICLENAGVSPENREMLKAMAECGCEKELVTELRMHRCNLLEDMHAIQKMIDCTDDLIRRHRR